VIDNQITRVFQVKVFEKDSKIVFRKYSGKYLETCRQVMDNQLTRVTFFEYSEIIWKVSEK